MNISVYKIDKVTARSHDLFQLLDSALPSIPEGSVVAIAAKIVSLCEGRVVPLEAARKQDLITQESQWYSPPSGKYDLSFAITQGMFVPAAGIDESNANGQYILWPKDVQASANAIWEYVARKHGHTNIGVIITDSLPHPLQWGTTGIAIAYSGFVPLKDYRGEKDIFGREMQFQTASIANGLAAAAVTMMGEGNEQTPIALIEDVPFVAFQHRIPTKQELAELYIDREDDMYWPFLKNTDWKKGLA